MAQRLFFRVPVFSRGLARLVLAFAIAVSGLAVALPSRAADFQTALAFYNDKQWLPAFLDFQILAVEGDARAQGYLGMMYRRGLGVATDYAEAEKWLRAGAEQGNALANHRLGWMYARGEIAGQADFTTAVTHWKAAAEGGNHQAQMDLGVMYWRGEGIPQDLVMAYSWLELASEDPELSAAKSNQDNLVKSMSAEQVAQAKELAVALRNDMGSH
jgi:TPR repeat protein